MELNPQERNAFEEQLKLFKLHEIYNKHMDSRHKHECSCGFSWDSQSIRILDKMDRVEKNYAICVNFFYDYYSISEENFKDLDLELLKKHSLRYGEFIHSLLYKEVGFLNLEQKKELFYNNKIEVLKYIKETKYDKLYLIKEELADIIVEESLGMDNELDNWQIKRMHRIKKDKLKEVLNKDLKYNKLKKVDFLIEYKDDNELKVYWDNIMLICTKMKLRNISIKSKLIRRRKCQN